MIEVYSVFHLLFYIVYNNFDTAKPKQFYTEDYNLGKVNCNATTNDQIQFVIVVSAHIPLSSSTSPRPALYRVCPKKVEWKFLI